MKPSQSLFEMGSKLRDQAEAGQDYPAEKLPNLADTLDELSYQVRAFEKLTEKNGQIIEALERQQSRICEHPTVILFPKRA